MSFSRMNLRIAWATPDSLLERYVIGVFFEDVHGVFHRHAEARVLNHGQVVAAVADGHDFLPLDAEFFGNNIQRIPFACLGMEKFKKIRGASDQSVFVFKFRRQSGNYFFQMPRVIRQTSPLK